VIYFFLLWSFHDLSNTFCNTAEILMAMKDEKKRVEGKVDEKPETLWRERESKVGVSQC